MPSCCIKNCKSRTFYTKNREKISFYRFPNEENIYKQWIDACGRNMESLKLDSARICNVHFEDSCFTTQWTQSMKTPAKKIKRLKKGSLSTKMLFLEKKRDTIFKTGKKLNTKTCKQQTSEISTYIETEPGNQEPYSNHS